MFRFGVVGLGLGFHHAEKIHRHTDGWQLAAVCEALESRADRFSDAYRDVPVFSDYTTFLREADLDGVVLALPHDLHAPLAIQAMEAGKHVLVEKPMARNTTECEAMNSVARRTGKTLMIAQNWRYTPWVRTVRQVVEQGELGPLRAVRSDWLQNAVGDTRPGNWLLDGIRAGGGPMISLMVHNIDFLRYLLGEPESVHAYCLTGHPAFANDAENWGMAQFRFERGVVGQILTSYSAFTPDYSPLWLYGEEGTLYYRDAIQICSARRGADFRQLDVVDNAGLPTEDPTINELLHFVECAQSDSEPLSSGFDNVKTIRFVEAIYESSRSGSEVLLSGVQLQ